MANFYATYAKGSVATVTATLSGPLGQAVMASSFPVAIASDQSPIPVSGTITATNPSVGVTGAAVPADATFVGMNVGGNLTGIPGTASGLKVDGSAVTQPVSGTFWQATQPVSGTFWQATQPVSGTVTANAGTGTFAVSGTVSSTQGTTPWSSNVSQFGGNPVVTGTGASQAGVPRVVVSSDSTLGLVAGTALIGKVGIDQTTPGTTNGVVVNTIAAVTTSTATFQAEGSIAFGSITGSFQTVFTPSSATKILQMRNNTNAAISVSFDAGTTTHYVLDAGDQVSFDLLSNSLAMTTTAIQIKQTSGAPTSGSFRVNACH